MSGATTFARALLGVSAALHLYFGLAFVADPAPWMDNLEIAARSPAGRVEMTAFYGGLLSSLGVLFAASACIRSATVCGTLLMSVTYFGAASARAYALTTTGASSSLLFALLAIEVCGALLGALALYLLARRSSREGGADPGAGTSA